MRQPALKTFAACAASAASLLGLAACVSPQLGRSPAPRAAAAVPVQAPSPTPAPELQYPQSRPMDEKKPVKLKSDRLRYDDKLKETEFIGHVVATQDSMTLHADRMRSATQGESASAKGHLLLEDPSRKVELSSEEGDYSGALSEANLRGGVVLHSVDPYGLPVTVTGQSGWYQSASRLARLTGDVTVERGRLTATAERAFVDGGADLLELDGQVKAEMGPNRIEASRAVLDGKKKSVAFEGGVEASLIPAQVRDSSLHPEKP